MEDWKQNLAIGAASILLGRVLLNLMPEIETSSDVIDVLNSPLVQFLLLAIIIYVVISSIVDWFTRIVTKNDGSKRLVRTYNASKPDKRTIVGEIRYERVNWPFMWGRNRGQFFGWVDRPNCPTCGTGLDNENIQRRIWFDKSIWDCPSCDFSVEASDQVDRRRSVQRIVEQECERIILGLAATNNDEVESMVKGIEERAGVELDVLKPQYKMDDLNRQAVEDAVNEVVDEDVLQNREKVLVLDHLLGFSFGPQNQYEVLWWEGNQSLVQAAIGRLS